MLRRLMQRWCWPCLVLGLGLMMLTGVASAQAGIEDAGFTTRDLIVGLLALVMSLGGAYFAGMRSRLDKIEESLEEFQDAMRAAEKVNAEAVAKLERTVLRDYHSKAEVAADLGRIERAVEAVHRRLDRLNVPAAPPNGG